MKNLKKNVKGITLVSLIITVIVLVILASIGTYSGIEVIKSSKFTKFTTEMKIMQTHVNQLYEQYRNGDNEVLNLGKEINTVQAQADIVFSSSASGITDKNGYRYFDQETIQSLNIEGIEEEFFINVEKRSVVSYNGFEYDGTTYYTLEQLPNGLYNVDYEENTNKPDFETSVEAIEEGKWKVSVSNIEYDGYVSKWEVKYRLEGQENWNTAESMNFTINKEGVYIVTVSNKDVTINEKRIAVGVKEIEPEPSSITTLSTMLYGVIEIEFLNNTGYKSVTLPNGPILKDEMQAVYWATDENGEIDSSNPANNTYEMTSGATNFKKEDWYKYLAQTGETDGKTSRWANAITSDGSYYVWVPRYAYRIIYFNSEENEKAYRAGTLTEEAALESGAIVGYSDARGIVDKDGKRPTGITSTTSISINDKYFRTHPVFDGNPDEGGWDSKLTGIWVMKYEASRDDASENSRGTGIIPKSVPNVRSWSETKISEIFNYAKTAYNTGEVQNTTLNSHMLKNSEWGAVAYLTDSKYGRNGEEISVNQCSFVITGLGRGSGENMIYNLSYAQAEQNQQYNGEIGMLSSTTGNIYGIYDMSGGGFEYVMGFYGETENILLLENIGFDESNIPKREYYNLYSNNIKDLGHSMSETNSLSQNVSWNDDGSLYLDTTDNPILIRGGQFSTKNYAGIYAITANDGTPEWSYGFRVCLAINE